MDVEIKQGVDQNVLERFQRLIRCERLAHAYLMIGPDGSGKCETAFAIAKALNCESSGQTYCGECASCRKIDSGNHPDVLFFDQGEGQSIKIHKVREIIQRMQLCPYEAKKKVVIIKDIDLFTTEGANALLKTLEEPTASSLMFLTTAVPEKVLATVKSRCHAVHFFGLSRQDLTLRLRKGSKISEEKACLIAGFAEGCFGKARQLYDQGFIARKNEVINEFLFDGMSEASLKAIAADPQRIQEALEILMFCFKDLLLLKAGVSEDRLTHRDRVKDLRTCAARYSIDQLRDILSEIVSTKKMLDANLNVKVPLMLLKEKIWIAN